MYVSARSDSRERCQAGFPLQKLQLAGVSLHTATFGGSKKENGETLGVVSFAFVSGY